MTERAWYVGLPCRRCGAKVKVSDDTGLFVQPLLPSGRLGEPWAEHGTCQPDGGIIYAADLETAPRQTFAKQTRGVA